MVISIHGHRFVVLQEADVRRVVQLAERLHQAPQSSAPPRTLPQSAKGATLRAR